ncbi:MAG: helicase, partial [Maioricimonas sp. JB049]
EQIQGMFRERKWALPLADKLLMLFRHEYPDVRDVRTTPVWVVGDLLHFGGDFNKYISGRDLAKQEGLIFRHLLGMIPLLGEFSQVAPPGMDHAQWRSELQELSDQLTESCRGVDPESTDKALESMQGADVVAGEGGEASELPGTSGMATDPGVADAKPDARESEPGEP